MKMSHSANPALLVLAIFFLITFGAANTHSATPFTGLLGDLLETLPKSGESYIVETTTISLTKGNYPSMINRVHLIEHGFAIETLTRQPSSNEYALLQAVVRTPQGILTLDYSSGYPNGLLQVYTGNESQIARNKEIREAIQTHYLSFVGNSIHLGILSIDFTTLNAQDSHGGRYKGNRLEFYNGGELELNIEKQSNSFLVSVSSITTPPRVSKIVYRLEQGRCIESTSLYGENFDLQTRKALTKVAHPSIPNTLEAWIAHYQQSKTILIRKNLETGVEIQKLGEDTGTHVESVNKVFDYRIIVFMIILTLSAAAIFALRAKNKK